MVAGNQVEHIITPAAGQTKVVSSPGTTRGKLLNAGVAAANGDVLLSLWPGSQLPPDAVSTIERNLKLLPQTIGGNFHVKFDDNSLFVRLLARLLKKWRYRGHYYGNSGIFVHREIYEAIGGFQSYKILEDYDFAQRMEKFGPTLYLPDTIIASAHKFKDKKLRTALIWLTAQFLFALGLSPNRLARLWARV